MLPTIPEYIDNILKILENAGFEAYLVGGCVRDMLSGKVPHDYDITTDALPDQIKKLFSKTADTGIKHGTVTVIESGKPVEITTYRTESGYTDHRRPDSVDFVSNLYDDLSRRDFTVNALAYNPRIKLVDNFGGENDLKNRILRAVGDPERRFTEDALRILRLFRFASVLGFDIEKNTEIAAVNCSPLLTSVSTERIAAELQKAVCGTNPESLDILLKCGALRFLGLDFGKSLKLLSLLPEKTEIRLFAFFKLCGSDPEVSAKRLKYSNRITEFCRIQSILDRTELRADRTVLKKVLCFAGEENLYDCLYLRSAFYKEDISFVKCELDGIISDREPYNLKMLEIGGKELTELELNGKDVGKILSRLLEDVICDPALNRRELLIEKAKKYISYN